MPRIQAGLVPETGLHIKVSPKIGIGVTTVAGGFAAIAQYLGAVALILSGGDLTTAGIGTLATATVTLLTVLAGRYKQASDAIKALDTTPVVTTATDGPEPGVLYLDNNALAQAVVKAINTNALMGTLARPETTQGE